MAPKVASATQAKAECSKMKDGTPSDGQRGAAAADPEEVASNAAANRERTPELPIRQVEQ